MTFNVREVGFNPISFRGVLTRPCKFARPFLLSKFLRLHKGAQFCAPLVLFLGMKLSNGSLKAVPVTTFTRDHYAHKGAQN